jgi:hypothetical protein
MEKETVLEIEFMPIWEKWAWRVIKQDEEILKRNEFIDKELNVESFRSPEFLSLKNKLFIRGNEKRWDDNISICNQEEKALIEEKVKAINEKYGIKKRWRAEKGSYYYFIDHELEINDKIDDQYKFDNEMYENGNYFQTTEEAEEYAEYMKKCSLEWHERKGNNE